MIVVNFDIISMALATNQIVEVWFSMECQCSICPFQFAGDTPEENLGSKLMSFLDANDISKKWILSVSLHYSFI